MCWKRYVALCSCPGGAADAGVPGGQTHGAGDRHDQGHGHPSGRGVQQVVREVTVHGRTAVPVVTNVNADSARMLDHTAQRGRPMHGGVTWIANPGFGEDLRSPEFRPGVVTVVHPRRRTGPPAAAPQRPTVPFVTPPRLPSTTGWGRQTVFGGTHAPQRTYPEVPAYDGAWARIVGDDT